MTKLKSLTLKYRISLAIAMIIGSGSAFAGVMAYQNYGNAPKVVVEGNYIEAGGIAEAPLDAYPVDEILGAVSGPALPNPNCQADSCTYTAVGNFIDASTTILSVAVPFEQVTTSIGDVILRSISTDFGYTAATTTVDLVRLNITGAATTSFRLACGSSDDPTGTIPLVRVLASTTPELDVDSIPTSTKGIIENNITAAQGGIYSVGAHAKIMLDKGQPYFVCIVDPLFAAGFTNADNTFAGQYTVRFTRTSR